ncbi:Nicotinate dehydrogenase small FeS subunit [Candidatus Thermoflexus japonica]|uniref:Nicotinate dehydrogenase small FeS subunit n=1 Tax=Candidatus Thermoflexus japonica TaxID=2035417 RepID=A0A2H5Y643_9CHLR|nr:Nicotinate dehydrogenase small FeS subunit [Candidatus Thermoflexus japonica]
MKQTFELRVNGRVHRIEAAPDRRLLEVLREDLGLGSVREGCGIGMCGACTVLLGGRPVSSCLLLVSQVHHQEIVTVEGLEENGALHPVQRAFIEHFAFQCAYCTPGFVLSAVAMLEREPDPDEQVLLEYLSGNLCRCGSYLNILKAVRAAAQGRRLHSS